MYEIQKETKIVYLINEDLLTILIILFDKMIERK